MIQQMRRFGATMEFGAVGRRNSTFRMADATKAMRAVRAVGLDVQQVDIAKDGKISIITSAGRDQPPNETGASNEWDGAV
jgi:hypothetical protein